MPSLPTATLFSKLRAALPATTIFHTPEDSIHPAECTIPGFGRARFYLFTVTPDRSQPGARPPGEYKIQLIIEGQARSARGNVNLENMHTALLGFSPDFGVFVAWESRLYRSFAYSANVQVREAQLVEARDHGWSVGAPRSIKGSSEVRIAFSQGNLLHYLRISRDADAQGLIGTWREAYFLSRIPNYQSVALPTRQRSLDDYIHNERQRLATTRLARNAKFSPRVKEQFDYSCAVCRIQLEIVEAAHIIPANDPRGSDEIWNGITLCPSHHALFDAKRFVVASDLTITIDLQAVEFLKDSKRATGIELLTAHDKTPISRPFFWTRDRELKELMQQALAYSSSLAAIQ